MSGRRSQRTYAVRSGGERWAFVPHPEIAGWWFRCHLSVMAGVCPDCSSPAGHPCRDRDGAYVTWTHYQRRSATKEKVASLELALGIVAQIEQPRRRSQLA